MKKVKKHKWLIVALAIVFIGMAMFLTFLSRIHLIRRFFPMTTEKFVPCDMDGDRDCDENDFEIATNAIGQCIDGGNYIRLADADHDGCVTKSDLQSLFPDMTPSELSEPGSDYSRRNWKRRDPIDPPISTLLTLSLIKAFWPSLSSQIWVSHLSNTRGKNADLSVN